VWIRNDLVLIRILLFRSFLIRILPFKPDQPPGVHNGTAAKLFKFCQRNICKINDEIEMDHMEEKFASKFIWLKRSGPDPIPFSQI
jgi:hypothetical protein